MEVLLLNMALSEDIKVIFQEKITNKTIEIGIVGLGYVGLPLAVSTARFGCHVVGFDVDMNKIDSINSGVNYVSDVNGEDLKRLVEKQSLKATDDFRKLIGMDAIIICVPTPIDKYKQPDLTYIKSVADMMSNNISKGTLIILESTTYPGTTEEVLKPVIDSKGLICGEDYYLAYSPERIDPGNKEFKTDNTPKVVGGCTPNSTHLASLFYQNVLGINVFEVSNTKVAEMEKLLENTFRNVNIALVNELAMLCHRMDIDVWEVIAAAATKPYGFMPFYPGPGIGGHCIPIDPWYLSWKAKEFNFNTKIIETAESINQKMPEFVVNRCMKILNEYGKPMNNANVVVLGISYKKDIADYRESPALSILEELSKLGANWTVVDPHVERFHLNGHVSSIPLKSFDLDMINKADLVIIVTDHSCFDYEVLLESETPIFDTRNISRKYALNTNSNYYIL